MTVQTDAVTPQDGVPDADFDLDIRIVESGPVIADLMRNTDDNCGSTCQSACANSTC
ncbi:MAG: FxLD family lanthipeptide [Pseudonocardia sp.]